MKHNRTTDGRPVARSVFPELAPALPAGHPTDRTNQSKPAPLTATAGRLHRHLTKGLAHTGHIKAATLSFSNLHEYGDLFANLLKARKTIFIDRLRWGLPEAEGMEFDQYDTPLSRWVVVYEYGEVLAGIRLTPSTARCGMYSYMLRDAQKGLLESIPSDVLFFDAPVNPRVWEASRVFISDEVPAHRRMLVQATLVAQMTRSARAFGATHVIGIVPSIWSRWLRRLDLSALPAGPKFVIDDTKNQAILFKLTSFLN